MILVAVLWHGGALAFRSCDTENSQAFSAATQYTVGELVFDQLTGTASGTKTIYNFANHYGDGRAECHITYELSGSYGAGSGTFVLDAKRTNFSTGCPQELIANDYPPDRTYALQMNFSESGAADVNYADNGELLARGSWEHGRTVYKTGEACTIF